MWLCVFSFCPYLMVSRGPTMGKHLPFGRSSFSFHLSAADHTDFSWGFHEIVARNLDVEFLFLCAFLFCKTNESIFYVEWTCFLSFIKISDINSSYCLTKQEFLSVIDDLVAFRHVCLHLTTGLAS